MRGPPPLHIDLRRSPIAAVVVIAFLATATLLALLPGFAWLRGAAVVAIGAYAMRTLRVAALRTAKGAIVGVEVSPDGRAALLERSGARREGRVQPECYLGTWLTTPVVRIDAEHWSQAMAIHPDMLSAEELRRLRILLRVVGSKSQRRAEPP
ncbi:MAG TPA: hypothetical protein VL742_00760 [Casimicrobiaceae bacterium]|nr:hypothetical protein [Casimicrobiaceae bacterium]